MVVLVLVLVFAQNTTFLAPAVTTNDDDNDASFLVFLENGEWKDVSEWETGRFGRFCSLIIVGAFRGNSSRTGKRITSRVGTTKDASDHKNNKLIYIRAHTLSK